MKLPVHIAIATGTCFCLAGCAATPPSPADMDKVAVVDATSNVGSLVKRSNYVTIDSVNGKSPGINESRLVLAPGQYEFKASCAAYDAAGDVFSGKGTMDVSLLTGHRYVFTTEDPTKRSLAESLWVLGHSGPFKKSSALQSLLISLSDDCAPVLYDATSNSNPYPEQVTVMPPDLSKGWKPVTDDRNAGHWMIEQIPVDEDPANGKTVMETEYWSSLMYPKTANELFKARAQNLQQICPDAQVTLSTESKDAVEYEFETPDCPASPARSELGRFLTGPYGVHRASVLSRLGFTAADKESWSRALHNATLTQL